MAALDDRQTEETIAKCASIITNEFENIRRKKAGEI